MQTSGPAARAFAGGRYTVRRVLGEGSQKIVYLVQDETLGRECALAWIKVQGLEADVLGRLQREAGVIARLGSHPNIVTVFDVGEQEGRPYLTCEYLSGGDLRQALRAADGPLAIDRALTVAQDLCRGLTLAHAQGVLHRDVKPDNIWLTADGTAKLGDFGLAVALGQSRMTAPGTVLGTAAYMAPEQALGSDVDARADLYSLGCVLYEMVTGRPPFSGDDIVAIVSQHIHTAPVAPSWHNPGVKALDGLILRLLAKRPEDRPGRAAEVLQELLRITGRHPETTEPPEPRGVTGLAGLTWGHFVGRRVEMERLIAALEDCLSAKSTLVMIAGEPGIGKTRLAEEFAVYASLRGARVLTGRCSEGAGSVPYRPWVAALGEHTSGRADDDLRREMGAGAPEVLTLLPGLRPRFPDVTEAPRLEPDAERLRLFDSLAQFIKNASQSEPLVLCLDDLHWADKPSLLLLQHVARDTARDRLLIIGAYRDVELDRTHPLAEAMSELRRSDHFQRIHVRGLPQEDVAELLTSIEPSPEAAAGSEALARALYEETEGNPFFIREVLSHLVEEEKIVRRDGRWTSTVTTITDLGIPEGVREAVGRRLARLSEGCNRMLARLSAMTGGFTWEVLKAICDEPEEQLLELLEDALAAQLVIERRDAGAAQRALAYDFTHALIRQTLYEELSGPRRLLLHRQIGEALESLYASNIDAHLAELTYHFCQAAPGGDVEKAVEYARRAGNEASELAAYEEALRLYQLALETLDFRPEPDENLRCRLLIALGAMQLRSSDGREGRETLQRAAALAREIEAPDLLARAAVEYGWRFDPGAVEQDLVSLLQEALATLTEEDNLIRWQLLSRLSLALYWSDRREEGYLLAQEAIEVARQTGDAHALGWAVLRRHFTLWLPEELEQRLAAASEVVLLGERYGDNELVFNGRFGRLMCLLELGDVRAADTDIAETDRLAEALRWSEYRWGSALLRVVRALLDGRFDEAEPLAQQALSTRDLAVVGAKSDVAVTGARKVQRETAVIAFGVQLMLLRREQGRIEELEDPARDFVSNYPSIPGFRCVLALLYADLGREAECRIEYERLAAHDFTDFPRDYWWMGSLALLAEVSIYLGDVERASILYEMFLPYDGRMILVPQVFVVLLCYGPVSRHLGLLAGALGRLDDAVRHLDDALELSKSMSARPWVAHAQHDCAHVLLRRGAPGDRERASALLREALAAAEEMGMLKLVLDCQELLTKSQA